MSRPIRIIVGIDFGTTFSGIAWADSAHPEQVEIIRNYPSSGQLVGQQVPTEIAYEDGDTTQFSWGYDINFRMKKVKWFKLGLEADHDVMQLPPGLGAQDVVKDYLSALYSHAMSTLYQRFDRSLMAMTKVDFVLTVPAIWSEKARSKTEEAAQLAGFGSSEHSLQLLSEPEAAALYTFKFTNTANSQVKVGDRIVVCDAGGGTVDLISYDITQTHPFLSVQECAAGTGDYCGSTFIDRNFEKLFAQRMGDHYEGLSIVNRQHVVKNFESAKVAFRDVPDRSFFVNVPTISDLPEAGVVGGGFELTRDDMKSLFDPVVDQIIALIRDQVRSVSQGTERVNSILLVGGFGESPYVYTRVNEWAEPYGIVVIQPREASTAIVRGAVLKGIENDPTNTEVPTSQFVKKARKSYGVPSNQLFIPNKHLESDSYIDKHSGQKMAGNQVSWFIHKNQPITDDQIFKYGFSRQFRKISEWKDSLVCCEEDIPPSRNEPHLVKKLCTISSDLSHLKKSKFKRKWKGFRPYRVATYQLVMSLKQSNMRFNLEYDNQMYGVSQVEFE